MTDEGDSPFKGKCRVSDKRVAVRLRICRKAIVHRPVAFGESPHPTNSQSELPTFPTRGKASFFRSVLFNAEGDLSTKSLNAILPPAPLKMTAGGRLSVKVTNNLLLITH